MDRQLLCAIHRITFLTLREKELLADILSGREAFLALTLERLYRMIGRRGKTSSFDPQDLWRKAERDCSVCEHLGISVVAFRDLLYPPQLREIFDPPFILFVRGTLPTAEKPMIAVVGTRRPTGKAVKACYGLGLECASFSIPVVSGLARGIDGAVHSGTVDGGGATVAVLGCGIDRIYPSDHRNLAGKIIDTGGAVVSEYPPGEEPKKYYFPQRNRIISGLSRAVVLGQCPVRSGALITADYALEQGREVVVLAEGLDGGAGEGGRDLTEQGAAVIYNVSEIFGEWGVPRVQNSYSELKAVRTGAEYSLAELMELELQGRLVNRMGARFLVGGGV